MTILLIVLLLVVAIGSIVGAMSTEGGLQGAFSFLGFIAVLGAMVVASI